MHASAQALPTAEELAGLLESAVPPRDNLILQLLATVGCRPRDLVRLQPTNITGSTVRLGGKDIAVSAALGQALAAQAAGCNGPYLFSARQGRPLTVRRIRQITAEHSRRALGRVLTPRQLRYAAIRQHFLQHAAMEHIQAAAGISWPRLAQLRKELARPEGGAADA